jgi:TM2 domain-containing membrane protein YozV
MSSNINTAYQQHWEDFFRLGKSMKNYATASWISLAATFFGSIIIQMVFIVPMMTMTDSGIYDDPYTMLMGMLGIVLFFFVVALAISIYQFVTYIQYLIQLKKVWEYTNDIDLQKAYKMELWAMIISIIMVLSIPVMFLIFFGGSFMIDFSNDAEIYGLFMILFGILVVIMIFAILSIILQVLSVFAFDRWGQRIKMADYQNPYGGNIAEGTNFMKLGKIISIFAGNIGLILFLIGFMKAGKNIMVYFEGFGTSTLSQGPVFAQSSSGSTLQQPRVSSPNPNLNSSYMGNTTMKPQGEGFCSFCGSELDDKRSLFCSTCGRKLF